MTNSPANSTQNVIPNLARSSGKQSDQAPMVITRLSGWIDCGEGKSVAPSWIVPTRSQGHTR